MDVDQCAQWVGGWLAGWLAEWLNGQENKWVAGASDSSRCFALLPPPPPPPPPGSAAGLGSSSLEPSPHDLRQMMEQGGMPAGPSSSGSGAAAAAAGGAGGRVGLFDLAAEEENLGVDYEEGKRLKEVRGGGGKGRGRTHS